MDKLTRKTWLLLDKNEYQGFYAWAVFSLVVGGVFFVVSNSNGRDYTDYSALPAPKPTPLPTKTSTGDSGTFRGSAYQTPWGNAVASITVANGKITGVTMPQVPPSPPSEYAAPYLIQQALAAGSANIQGVSGATYTSIAFKSSLESAILLANTTAGAQGKATVISSPASSVVTPTPVLLNRKLRNGTYLGGDIFSSGEGTLKVSNGTAYDSVLKLVTSKTGERINYVYISANSNYTIGNIPDGSYRVLFSSGMDWDGKKFTRNRSSQSFDDSFDYTTDVYSDGGYEHTRYTTYNLTLNPVVGGTAQTANIDQNIFDTY